MRRRAGFSCATLYNTVYNTTELLVGFNNNSVLGLLTQCCQVSAKFLRIGLVKIT